MPVDKKKFKAMKRPDGTEVMVHIEDVEHRIGLGWKVDNKSSLYDDEAVTETTEKPD